MFDMEFETSREYKVNRAMFDIFVECRANKDLYRGLSGTELRIGETDWEVVYRQGSAEHGERVYVYRDFINYRSPMYYALYSASGYAAKNENVIARPEGGVRISVSDEETIEDPAELESLHAIITAAHSIKRSTA